jgi:hypothetical protein
LLNRYAGLAAGRRGSPEPVDELFELGNTCIGEPRDLRISRRHAAVENAEEQTRLGSVPGQHQSRLDELAKIDRRVLVAWAVKADTDQRLICPRKKLSRDWTLSVDDNVEVLRYRGDDNRMRFALQLCALRAVCRFVYDFAQLRWILMPPKLRIVRTRGTNANG